MYLRTSHKIASRLLRLSEEPKVINNDHDPSEERPHSLPRDKMAVITLHKSLFLENIDIIRDIVKDCVKIYSSFDEVHHGKFFEESSSKPLTAAYLEKLMDRKQPATPSLRTTFRQVMGFITSQNRQPFGDDINYLLSFINELRLAHSTLTNEDKKLIKSLADDSVAVVLDTLTKDATLFLYWACTEVSRYCVNESNISIDLSTHDFLLVLNSELSRTGKFSEKYLRQFYVIFLQCLEKALNCDFELSPRSFPVSSTVSKQTRYNQMLHSWIVSNRERMAELSIRVNDPAQCWRNMDIKLSAGLAHKQKSFTSRSDIPSYERLDLFSWRRNLSLITQAAIQLNDLDLLHGIEYLIDETALICDFPSLRYMVSNLKGNYEQTYFDLVGKSSFLADKESLNEYLKACLELNLLHDNVQNVELLQSVGLKGYKNLIGLKDPAQFTLESRLKGVKQWLETWSDLQEPLETDLLMSSYLKAVSSFPREPIIAQLDDAEWFLSQYFITQTLFSPSQINSKTKIYNVLIELLRCEDKDKCIPIDIVDTHAKNPQWNSLLLRHINDLNLLCSLRQQGDAINLIQYRAIKHHQRSGNTRTAMKLLNDLNNSGASSELILKSSLLSLDKTTLSPDKFKDILGQIEFSTLGEIEKNDLRSKVFRRFLRCFPGKADSFIKTASYEAGDLRLDTSDELTDLKWQDILNTSSDLSKMRSLSLISEICNDKSGITQKKQSFNSLFMLDLALLRHLNKNNSAKYISSAIECAIRLIKCISQHHSQLRPEVAESFSCKSFLEETLHSWIPIKNNLISLVTDEKNGIPISWKKALAEPLRMIVQKRPNILLYSIIVNRLENRFLPKPDTVSPTVSDEQSEDSNKKQKQNYDLWRELHSDMITMADTRTDDWLGVIQDTEGFIKEMRRISYLSGENLYVLSTKINRKLNRIFNSLRRQTLHDRFSTEDSRIECEAHFKSLCTYALKQIDCLLLHSNGPNPDTYGTWFKSEFSNSLRSLKILFRYLLNQLLPFTSPEKISSELQLYVPKINDTIINCKQLISSYSNQLWMHLISPKLSRLEPSGIPLPGCCIDSTRQPITIYKVSQTIESIGSKTKPKKLILVGSDGLPRSFLLKAHENLQQDQYMMDIFTIINKFLYRDEKTRNISRLRTYSVTPISDKSGLIEWVDATALTSICENWLASPSGRTMIEKLYSSTCRVLCGTAEVGAPKSDHANCQAPQNTRMMDIFYQLIWSEMKKFNSQSELAKQKPSHETILRYIRELYSVEVEVKSIIEKLINCMPNNVISNSLWRRSINSYSYWSKTKQFTNSCATISMVGYVIGLGDRHLGNILLDHDTGEVIHIDMNVLFEMGKEFAYPEQVPFRLTQNITRAFGFAGLEGGFTRTSRKVLELLRANKSTLLHLLEPTNWSFMVELSGSCETPAAVSAYHQSADSSGSLVLTRDKREPYVCQRLGDDTGTESMVAEQEAREPIEKYGFHNISNLLQLQLGSVDYDENQKPFLNDLLVNIDTPIKLTKSTASYMFERISDKLSGTDEPLSYVIEDMDSFRPYRKNLPPEVKQVPTKKDPKLSDGLLQSVNEQVEALIIEATSITNLSSMYQGWMAWF